MRALYKDSISVRIEPETYTQIFHATRKIDTEVTGWLAVDRNKLDDGTYEYVIHGDLIIPKQEVTSTTVDVEAVDMALMIDKHDQMYPDRRLACWWHSHVNMETSPSGTDETQMYGYAQSTPFYIMLITNKKGNYGIEVWDMDREVIYHKSDIQGGDWFIGYDMDHTDLDDALKQNVKAKPYTNIWSKASQTKTILPQTTPTYTMDDWGLKPTQKSIGGYYDDDDQYIQFIADGIMEENPTMTEDEAYRQAEREYNSYDFVA
jgi:proteasome lid subunit RPN8/RPN11